MEWQDEGTVLRTRRHGESSAILEVFTEARGRHAGVVRGATSRNLAPLLQPGTQLTLTWRARLEDHLGSYTIEPVQSRADLMAERLSLAALNAVTALLCFSLPEREGHPRLYHRTLALLDMIGSNEAWPIAYLHWELALLDEMGFGLDMSGCAVTGAQDGLAYISPRTGRAVTEAGAGTWKDRLLPLPPCLQAPVSGSQTEISDAMRTTGFFLKTWLAPALGNTPLPSARERFVDAYARLG